MIRGDIVELIGENLILRLIDDSDEDFIRFLTVNGSLHRYLTAPIDEINDFNKWIEEYKERERAGTEYFFIIENFNGIRYGTVRIYNIIVDECAFGNFFLLAQRPLNYPFESADLIFQFIFERLQLRKIHLKVLIKNLQAIQLFQLLGFKEESRDERMIYMFLLKENFIKDRWRDTHEGNYFSWRDWF